MARSYTQTRKKRAYGEGRSYSMLIILTLIAIFIVAGVFVMNARKGLNEDLASVLETQRQAEELNVKLKTELAGITQTRLMELKANERLGLKRAKEEEVLVLR